MDNRKRKDQNIHSFADIERVKKARVSVIKHQENSAIAQDHIDTDSTSNLFQIQNLYSNDISSLSCSKESFELALASSPSSPSSLSSSSLPLSPLSPKEDFLMIINKIKEKVTEQDKQKLLSNMFFTLCTQPNNKEKIKII